MDLKFPNTCDIGDFMAVSSDFDSAYLLTGTMKDVAAMLDSTVKPGSFIIFSSTIVRTYNNNGSRFLLFYPEPIGRPKSRFGTSFPRIALERFANINLFDIVNSCGVKLHLTYIFLGREIIDSNYLTKLELAVLVSSMNYAKMYYFHPLLPANHTFENTDQMNAYASFLQAKHVFEGQVNVMDGNKLKKNRASVTFCSHYGRLYVKSVFETLKMYGDNIEVAMNCGGMVPPGRPLIMPWDVKFHGIPSLEFTQEIFSTLATAMYTKGALLAQDPGTKDHFTYSPIENRHVMAVNNGVEWGQHFQEMLTLQNDRFAGMFDPNRFMPIREDTIDKGGGVFQHYDDHFVDRTRREGGLLKFYDAGFMLNPVEVDSMKCFLPNGPKCGWWLNLLMSRVRFEDAVRNPNATALSIVRMATLENDVALLQGIIDNLHMPQTDPNAYIHYNNIMEILEGYMENPPNLESGDFELTLLQMLQDWEPDDLGTGNGLTVDTLLGMMHHTGQRAYNVFGTNGKAANIHTGKVEVRADIMDQYQDDFPEGTIKLSFTRPAPDRGHIRGGQIYNPVQRTLIMTQVRKNMNEMLNIPNLLLELLRPDQVGPRLVAYSETRSMLHSLMTRLKDLVGSIATKIELMSSFGLRIELFMQYDRFPATEFENLYLHPCPSGIVDAYEVDHVRTFLHTGITRKFAVIEKIVDYDAINDNQFQRSDFASSLSADEITTLVMFSEQLLINLGICHYQGRYIYQMQKKKTGVGERIGAFCIPEMSCTEAEQNTQDRLSLPFTVSCEEYLARPMNTQIHDPTFTLRGYQIPSYLVAEADSLRKIVFLPLLYVQAMEKIRCLVLQAVDRHQASYTPLDRIDYNYIACDLPAEDRRLLVTSILQELCSVYDYCWYTLINEKNKDLRIRNVTRQRFPRTLEDLETFLNEHADIYPHIHSISRDHQSFRIRSDDDLYTKCCGSGSEHVRSWTTFCCFQLARNLEVIWNNIKLARERGIAENAVNQLSSWDPADLGETGLTLFSKEHLRYSFAREFKEWHCNGVENSIPLVWFTRPSSLKCSIGTYCLYSISRERIRGIPTRAVSRAAFLDIICDETKDTFWLSMNKAGGIGSVTISDLILFRLLCHFIFDRHNSGELHSPTKNRLCDHMVNIRIGEDNLDMLFGDRPGAVEFVNNHLCKKVKADLNFFDITAEESFLCLDLDEPFMKMIVLAFRGVGPNALRRAYTNTKDDHKPAANPVLFPYYDVDTPEVHHLNALVEGAEYTTLCGALKYACKHGILTESLTTKLLGLRVQFNKNRATYQCSDEATRKELADSNIVLLQSAGFTKKSGALMKMQKKTKRKRQK